VFNIVGWLCMKTWEWIWAHSSFEGIVPVSGWTRKQKPTLTARFQPDASKMRVHCANRFGSGPCSYYVQRQCWVLCSSVHCSNLLVRADVNDVHKIPMVLRIPCVLSLTPHRPDVTVRPKILPHSRFGLNGFCKHFVSCFVQDLTWQCLTARWFK
jgi:hypothetical protein